MQELDLGGALERPDVVSRSSWATRRTGVVVPDHRVLPALLPVLLLVAAQDGDVVCDDQLAVPLVVDLDVRQPGGDR